MEIATKEHTLNIDRKVFQQIFDSHYNALCAFAYRYIQNPLVVEDLVQESFVGLWESKAEFDQLNSVKAFLYTSVRNKCFNYLKHLKVVQKHQRTIGIEFEPDGHEESHIIEEETFNLLYQEIEKLPESARKIMILAMEGLKNQEIADKLQISINTVKTQKKIAYSRLKEKISPSFLLLLLAFGFF